ncbi:MAG: methionine synthase, partial [Candidatus Verstraetearchaeota archaeon]|nr:methionine synthase [Candidatus Verstraetearchaeota archaeon]
MENRTEGKEEIKELLRKIIDAYELDNLAWVHPDCGLRAFDRDVAVEKLKEMVKAIRELEVEVA